MNTVTDLEQLVPRVVVDAEEIDRLRWFQLNRYFESGLLDDLPTHLSRDPDVERSTYFGVYAGDQIQATARIVRSSSSLPLLDHHPLYPSARDQIAGASDTVAEISRLAVGRNTPHYKALMFLARSFLHYGLQNDHAAMLIASVEKPLVRILNRMLGVPLQIIGPSIAKYGQYNGEVVPIMIDPIECLANFRLKKSRRWEFFLDGAVIDLTDQATASPYVLSDLRAAS